MVVMWEQIDEANKQKTQASRGVTGLFAVLSVADPIIDWPKKQLPTVYKTSPQEITIAFFWTAKNGHFNHIVRD